MTNHEYCYLRDNKIIETLNKWKMLDIYQIQQLFFPSITMARKRVKILYDKKYINRVWFDKQYVYYTEKKYEQIEHIVGLNYIRMYTMDLFKNWGNIYTFEYMPNYGVVIPDALFSLRNNLNKSLYWVFVELDLSNNTFNKINHYNKWYESGNYGNLWWVKYAKKFPRIQIVTLNEARKKQIEKKIEIENKHNLFFTVDVYSKIKERCLCRSGNFRNIQLDTEHQDS